MVTAPCAPCVTPVRVSVPPLPLESLANTLMSTGVFSAVEAVSAPATGGGVTATELGRSPSQCRQSPCS